MVKYGEKTEKLRDNLDKMTALVHYQTAFRRLVAVMANYDAGSVVTADNWQPRFIYKCEGGVNVAGKEIVLSQGCVYDDFARGNNRKPAKEEQALVDALETVAAALETEPDPGKALTFVFQAFAQRAEFSDEAADAVLNKIAGRGNPFEGDPWRDFFGEAYRAIVRKKNAEAQAAGKTDRYF